MMQQKTKTQSLSKSTKLTKINEVDFNNLEISLLNEMSDGQWHAKYKLYKMVKTSEKQSPQSLKEGIDKTLSKLKSLKWVKEGNNDSFRLVREQLKIWRNISPTLDLSNERYKPRYFGEYLEDDGWELAPLRTYDMVHFRLEDTNIEQLELLLKPAKYSSIQVSEDGLIRIFTTQGVSLYNQISKIKVNYPALKVHGLRREKNLRRRDISELPKTFVEDLCKYYGHFSKLLLRPHMSSVTRHITDKDDIQQQIYIWIIEAIQKYDSTTSIPFAAYLSNSLNKWVHNLSRKSFGRSVADLEIKHSRAINAFQAENSREPNTEELAAILESSQSSIVKDKMAIDTVSNLRNVSTIHTEAGEAESPIASTSNTESQLDELVGNTLLSMSITTASLQTKNQREGLVALLAIYYDTWGKNVKSKKLYNFMNQPEVQKAKKKVLKSTQAIYERAQGHE